jgi:hypothetical protein
MITGFGCRGACPDAHDGSPTGYRAGPRSTDEGEFLDEAAPDGGHERGRSAISGKFVKQSTVKRSPKTTVNEATKKPTPPKKKSK